MLELISAAISLGAVLVLILAAAFGVSLLVLACMVTLIAATGRDGRPSLVKRLVRLCRRIWRLVRGGARKATTATRTAVASAASGTTARAVPKTGVTTTPGPIGGFNGRPGPRDSALPVRTTVSAQSKKPAQAKEPAASAPGHTATRTSATTPGIPIRVPAGNRTGVGPAPRNPSPPLRTASVQPTEGAAAAHPSAPEQAEPGQITPDRITEVSPTPDQVTEVKSAQTTTAHTGSGQEDSLHTIEMSAVPRQVTPDQVAQARTAPEQSPEEASEPVAEVRTARDKDDPGPATQAPHGPATKTAGHDRKAKPARRVTNSKPR